jgi:hypothetical protein
MSTKKVRIVQRVGNPSDGIILQPGATVDLPEVWADRYVAQGKAELVTKPKDEKKKKD